MNLKGFDLVSARIDHPGTTINLKAGSISLPRTNPKFYPGLYVQVFLSDTQIAIVPCEENAIAARKISISCIIVFQRLRDILGMEGNQYKTRLQGEYQDDALVCDFDGKVFRLNSSN